MQKYINTNATSALPLLSSWVPSMSYTAPTTLFDYWGDKDGDDFEDGNDFLNGGDFEDVDNFEDVNDFVDGDDFVDGIILRMGTVMILVSFIYKLNIVTHVMMGRLR